MVQNNKATFGFERVLVGHWCPMMTAQGSLPLLPAVLRPVNWGGGMDWTVDFLLLPSHISPHHSDVASNVSQSDCLSLKS